MISTKHFLTRSLQRDINDNDVRMALTFGVKNHTKTHLGQKSCLLIIDAITHLIEKLEALKDDERIDLNKLLN